MRIFLALLLSSLAWAQPSPSPHPILINATTDTIDIWNGTARRKAVL